MAAARAAEPLTPNAEGTTPDIVATAPDAHVTTPGEATAEFGAQTYIVQPGDTLSRISEQFYGNSKNYMRIFDANRGALRDQDTVNVGQELKIPME